MTETKDANILLSLPESDKEEFKENTESMSETIRRLIRSYNEAEDRYEVGEDMDYINVLLLKTYRNALQQHIQVLEGQVDKLDEELEKFEEEKEENDEVLLEIDLDIATKNL